MHSLTLAPGRAWPLGAHADGDGINFAVFSAHATRIDLCMFDESGTREVARGALPSHTHDVWHGRLPNVAPGLIYGLRAHGPWRPERGLRFNPNKLLLDPYTREIVGRYEWRDEHYGADARHPHHMDPLDNAAHALKARVVLDDYDWGDDRPPDTSLTDTVLYELHVKGFTRCHPDVPEALRGRYAGLASEAAIAHLQGLGITAVSVLPVHQRIDERRLDQLGLSNYWGYNSIGFFALEPRLAAQADGRQARDEFRGMVKRLHAAGIEVILDVVYNHTAEAEEVGPTISFRGLDNQSYYRLQPNHREHYENHTGCGNTLNLQHPRVLQLVLDSLRYWVGEMHVDGFRFDLAPVLGRTHHAFDRHAAFFTAVAQDPLLSRVKMIAEPWDIGPGGYQVGNFPSGWLEWNDHFRDSMRRFWIERSVSRGDFAQRLCASSDMFQPRGRAPAESVNYVVSHDGYTLNDLVSYASKHNLANGEDNRDGHGHSHNVNCGVEGPTTDAAIHALRERLKRALLATTLLAQGTPMLAAGDELGHTQGGNNNPYCQDNSTTWIDWQQADDDLMAYTSRVLALRRQALPLNNHWYDGLSDRVGLHDLMWLQADGRPLQGDDWNDPSCHTLACLIGKPAKARAPLLILVNGDWKDHDFVLPAGAWQAMLDSAHARGLASWQGPGLAPVRLVGHSLMVLAAAGHGLTL